MSSFDYFDLLDERMRYEVRFRESGIEVVGGGVHSSGEWEIAVIDPHQRRGPRVSIVGRAEADRFLERIRAR